MLLEYKYRLRRYVHVYITGICLSADLRDIDFIIPARLYSRHLRFSQRQRQLNFYKEIRAMLHIHCQLVVLMVLKNWSERHVSRA